MSDNPIKFSASVHSIPISFSKEVDEKRFVRAITIKEVNDKFKTSMISWHVATLENGDWKQVPHEKTDEEIEIFETNNDAENKTGFWYSCSSSDGWTLEEGLSKHLIGFMPA